MQVRLYGRIIDFVAQLHEREALVDGEPNDSILSESRQRHRDFRQVPKSTTLQSRKSYFDLYIKGTVRNTWPRSKCLRKLLCTLMHPDAYCRIFIRYVQPFWTMQIF